jgi:hypothetical protein
MACAINKETRMQRMFSSALLAGALALVCACGSSTNDRRSAVLFDSNLDKIPDKADTNGDGKPDVALGNLCQLVCDGTKLTGVDVDCDGEVDFDIKPIDLPEVCGGGTGGGSGNGGGSGGGTGLEACASSLNDKSVACERHGGAWSCVCNDAGAVKTVSYPGDDACSIPGGACF